MSPQPPRDVLFMAQKRVEARRQRDFANADEMRCFINDAGWEVVDTPDGFELHPKPAGISVLADLETWPEDVRRFAASLDDSTPHNCRFDFADVESGMGFAAGRNAALERAEGEIVMVADTSLEVTGELLPALLAALQDPTVAVAGPYGLVSADLREYEERTAGEVVAVQGYCLAARRADLVAVGGFRESFTFYRNADIDLSLRLRTAGPEVRRAVAVGAEHCRRHTHRAWEEADADERERFSRKNMRRILDRFADRATDLAVF